MSDKTHVANNLSALWKHGKQILGAIEKDLAYLGLAEIKTELRKLERVLHNQKKLLVPVYPHLKIKFDKIESLIHDLRPTETWRSEFKMALVDIINGSEAYVATVPIESPSLFSRLRKYTKSNIVLPALIAMHLASATPAVNAAEQKTAQTQTVTQISDAEINRYMSMKTVEDILAGTNVKYAQYQGNGHTNLPQLLNTGKPALVLFYSGVGDVDISKREAIIFRELIDKYGSQINFIAYHKEKNDGAKANRFDGIGNNLFGKSDLAHPSIIMYNKQIIDIFRGGPPNNKEIKAVITDCINYWIPPNLFNQDNVDKDGKIYRLNNTYNTWKTL